MRRRALPVALRCTPLAVLAVAAAPPALADSGPAPAAAAVRLVNARSVLLSFDASGETVDCADLLYSIDSGVNWNPAITQPAARNVLRFTAPDDGRYDFFFVLENAAGRSAEPLPGDLPHATVVIDTLAPILQVRSLRLLSGAPPRLHLLLTLLDEHLGPAPLSAFYRTAEGSWRHGPSPRSLPTGYEWPIPADAPAPLELRLVATDLAGNQAIEDVPSLPTTTSMPAPRATRETNAGASSRPATPAPETPAPAAAASAAPTPSAQSPFDPSNAAPNSAEPSNAAAPPVAAREIDRLLASARRHQQAGETALEIARLQDAQRLDPQQPRVLIRLAETYLRARRFADADRCYLQLLELDLNDMTALEGRALVAAHDRRYDQARAHLRRVLALQPERAAAALRLGDIEHRVGNTAAAREAWNLALAAGDAETRDKAQRRLDLLAPRELAPSHSAGPPSSAPPHANQSHRP